jgi:hypothetical protein
MPSTTFTSIAEVAFGMLNVYLPGESVSGADGNRARTICNRMLSGWGQRGQYIPVIARERFDLVADQGGPDDPYTIGSGGDFDTERPSNQNSIKSANLILTASDPEVRVPLGIYTDQAYDANPIPDQSNTQPTGLYYNPTYAGDLGAIFLWPVPDTAENDLELFLEKAIVAFADMSTTYYLPDGAEDAITYALALRLQGPFGKRMDPDDKEIAREVIATFKRSNAKLSDLMNDAYVFTQGRRTIYNLQTGSGG